MSNPVSEAHRTLALRTLARRRLCSFTQQTLDGYSPGWVHYDICARLERFSADVAAKKSPRLMLLVPPRHGKSELASIRLPAWHLGQYPDHEVINAGYNLDLPMIFSRKVRGLLRNPIYQQLFPDTQLDPDTQATEAWKTTRGGGFTAAGVMGGITGKGAHIFIIDDPLKNMEEADNASRRDLIEDWYQSTAYTRLAPGAGMLLIQTCWSDDDIAGRLQKRMRTDPMSDQFEIIKYPALSEAYEYRDEQTQEIIRTDAPIISLPAHYTHLRDIDTALHEERYPTEALKRMRSNVDPRIWSALYQQNPVPDEGIYFRKDDFRFERIVDFGAHVCFYTAWDFAIGEKNHNDFTVGATIAVDENDHIYVIDVTVIKADSFEIVETMLNVASRWESASGGNYQLGVEDGQIWRSIQPLYKKRAEERKIHASMELMKPLTDKMARARPLQGRMQQGRVTFPQDGEWVKKAVHEMLRFPGGVHDDIVDALAWAVRLSMMSSAPRLPEPVKVPSWKDSINLYLPGQGSSAMSA